MDPEPVNFAESDIVMFLSKPEMNKLSLSSIFGNNNPVKLEVCSGSGDWIVEKAVEHPDTNWVCLLSCVTYWKVALEIRTERVFHIWSRAILRGVHNVFILVRR